MWAIILSSSSKQDDVVAYIIYTVDCFKGAALAGICALADSESATGESRTNHSTCVQDLPRPSAVCTVGPTSGIATTPAQLLHVSDVTNQQRKNGRGDFSRSFAKNLARFFLPIQFRFYARRRVLSQ